jgi:tRNA dimethylallyltransferase
MISKNLIKNKQRILVILGPTSSGKTRLAVSLAAKYNGEIVSADSRQVYRGMDIGTGKDLDEYVIRNQESGIGKKKNKFPIPNSQFPIPYHLIDVADPKEVFNLAKYQKLAYEAIDDILSRGKLPILTGGTGLYLQAVIDGYDLSEVKPDSKLRAELEKKTIAQLFDIIQKTNKKFAEKINESDRKNKRRLIRYVEILKAKSMAGRSKNTPSPCLPAVAFAEEGEGEGGLSFVALAKKEVGLIPKRYDPLIIGISTDKEILNKRINKRLIERLEKEDMLGEVERLHREGLDWKRLESFGLEYKFLSLYLQEKLEYDEMVEKLFIAIRQFARRQMTWFRRWEKQGAKINWIKKIVEAGHLVQKFLK